MRRFYTVMVWMLLAGVIALAGCGTDSESEGSSDGDTMKIGAALPIAGDCCVYGEKFKAAYTSAVDEINENGGIDGKELEIVTEDSQEKPQVGKTAAEKLVNDEDILVLTGGRSSGV